MILRFDSRLDFSLTREICSVSERLVPGVKLCILDLREVERVFDSGVALISMLCKRLRQLDAEIAFRGMHPDIQRHMSYILPA
jgi:anti-anti-sigma regulatory factor